jgi:ABC-type lipoprotein export system ATPase subunit
MIALRNLEKSYSHGVSKTFVLRQIDLDVKEGEFLSIMGPSGAGKSTLLHILGMHDSVHIVGKKDLYPGQLSGGQQQLVAVARAVIASPTLILADEPTGNLHTAQGQEIMELFTQLNQDGTTIIQVTHSEANAAYGRRVIELRDGWVVKE